MLMNLLKTLVYINRYLYTIITKYWNYFFSLSLLYLIIQF